jgi:hypothetical protein
MMDNLVRVIVATSAELAGKVELAINGFAVSVLTGIEQVIPEPFIQLLRDIGHDVEEVVEDVTGNRGSDAMTAALDPVVEPIAADLVSPTGY